VQNLNFSSLEPDPISRKVETTEAMNFGAFGRTSRNHGPRGGGRRGGRQGGRGGRHGHNNRSNHNNSGNRGNINDVHFIEASGTMTSSSFTVAVQGCSHGELDSIYEALESYRDQKLNANNTQKSATIDVLLCCGDVQTLRNTGDYHALAVPQKYKA